MRYLKAVLFGIPLCALLAACAPQAPPLFPRRQEADTYLREVQDSGRIRIAVPNDVPPLGFTDASGRPQGFTVALARMIARALHVASDIRSYPSDRLQGLVAVGGADVAFPFEPITERVVRSQSPTDPYLVGHQRLLVRTSSGAEGLSELGGSRVCAYLDPQTGVPLDSLEPSLEVTDSDDLPGCGRALRGKRVSAVTSDDFLLAYLRRTLERSGGPATVVTGDSLNTVGYGARVVDRPGVAQFVSDVFAAAKSDGRWARAYSRWIAPAPDRPPTMDVFEAGALWPLDVPRPIR